MKRGMYMNFRYRLMQFMSGRNGPDMLTFVIVGISMALSFINIVLSIFTNRIVTGVIQLVIYALLGYAIFRFLSRNTYKRSLENQWFVSKINFIKKRKELKNARKADKNHVYKKCPYCKAVLRLPYRVGKHKTVCPRCSKMFTVKVKNKKN